MALDRVVNWDKEKPTKAEAEAALTNFLGGVGILEWVQDRYYIHLPGTPTPTLRGLGKCVEVGYHVRWIEVWQDNDSLYVITRQADEFTNALAEKLAEIFANHWHGTRE